MEQNLVSNSKNSPQHTIECTEPSSQSLKQINKLMSMFIISETDINNRFPKTTLPPWASDCWYYSSYQQRTPLPPPFLPSSAIWIQHSIVFILASPVFFVRCMLTASTAHAFVSKQPWILFTLGMFSCEALAISSLNPLQLQQLMSSKFSK